VRDLLQQAFGVPVFVENDANAAALAEWHFGARAVSSSGVSHDVDRRRGGLILAGASTAVLASAGNSARTRRVGRRALFLRQRGCLEAYVGGAAWTRRLRQIAPPGSRATALAGSREALKPSTSSRGACWRRLCARELAR